MKKVIFRILLNSLLGAILIFVWSKFINLDEIIEILKTVQIKYVLIFFVLFLVSTVLRSLRLRLLLSGQKISIKDIITLNYLSQFLSFFIPVRAGEITKGIYLSTQFNLPVGKTLVWVFIDRFLDFWMFLLLISILLMFVPTNIPATIQSTALIILLVLTALAAVSVKSERFLKKLTQLSSELFILPKFKKMYISFTHSIIEGFAVLRRQPKDLSFLILLSLIPAISDGLIWLALFSSLGKQVSVLQVVLGNLILGLTFLIPAAPGYVGSAEAAGLAVFGALLGFDKNLASAVTVLFHILTAVVVLSLGISSLYILKFDLNLVWKKLFQREK